MNGENGSVGCAEAKGENAQDERNKVYQVYDIVAPTDIKALEDTRIVSLLSRCCELAVAQVQNHQFVRCAVEASTG